MSSLTTRSSGFAKTIESDQKTEREHRESINRKKGLVDAVTTPVKEEHPEPSPLPRNTDNANPDKDSAPVGGEPIVKFTETELSTYVTAAIQQSIRESQAKTDQVIAELEAAKQAIDADAAKLRAELDTTRKEATDRAQILDNVFGSLNMKAPVGADGRPTNVYISSSENRGGISGKDAATEFMRIYEQSPTHISKDLNRDLLVEHRDFDEIDRYIRKNRESVRDGMEALMKSDGMLGGNRITQSATTRTDISPAFLDYLSSVTRMSHSQKYVFWQFTQVKIEAQKAIGDTIQVPRVANQIEGVSANEWLLTGQAILSGNDNNISIKAVSAKIEEYGLGKGANKVPMTISEFLMARSLYDLEKALQLNLGRDYNGFEDIAIRDEHLRTTQVLYNKKTSPVSAPATLAAGDDGTLTYNFLNNLYAYMSALQVPAYENGKYVLIVNPYSLAQLKNSLGQFNQFISKANLEELTNLFTALNADEANKVSAYEFDVSGFMIFSSNNIGSATVGVNTVTAAGAPRTFRTCVAMGGGAVGRGIAMPMTIRRDTNDDFGRRNRFTWISHESFVALDVDAAIVPATDQQTRVFEIRSCDAPF